MKTTILFLMLFLAIMAGAMAALGCNALPTQTQNARLPILCVLCGGLGGAIYCLRGVYLNACVRSNWDPKWMPWYFIRPFVSMACGGLAYVFLNAGLLILQSEKQPGTSNIGFYALALIAGLNVDRFLAKVEDVAQAAWGIEKSRVLRPDPPEEKHA